MSVRWSEMKAKVLEQKKTDPQRGTLSERAFLQVEEGLQHLRSVGYHFEIAPPGTLAAKEKAETKAVELTTALSIAQAQAAVAPQPGEQLEIFEAQGAGRPPGLPI